MPLLFSFHNVQMTILEMTFWRLKKIILPAFCLLVFFASACSASLLKGIVIAFPYFTHNKSSIKQRGDELSRLVPGLFHGEFGLKYESSKILDTTAHYSSKSYLRLPYYLTTLLSAFCARREKNAWIHVRHQFLSHLIEQNKI